MRSAPKSPVLLAALFALLVGCATTDMRTIQYLGVPHPPPSDASKIAILHEQPKEPVEKLGEVVVDASTDPQPPVSRIEDKLREGGARLGADALVLVHDGTHVVGAVYSGWRWNGYAYPVTERIVVAVAVKYKK